MGVDLAAAITLARAVIKERRAGRTVIHDAEGRVYSIPDFSLEGFTLKERCYDS